MTESPPSPSRWEALDILRGLSVVGMYLNLFPGDWASRYSWLDHAKWNGVTLIDMVAPAFLFCAGAGLALSFSRRLEQGVPKTTILSRLLKRMAVLIVIGVLINGIPHFSLDHWRLPGILQRIGLSCLLTGGLMLLLVRGRSLKPLPLAIAAFAILVVYGALLLFVPAPGFGEPRLDQLGSWPSLVDRAVFGVDHLWDYGFDAGDQTVVYDPDGLLSTLPVCFNLLAGAVTVLLWTPLRGALAGGAMIVAACLLDPLLPINKSLWTSSFALFSTGVSLVLLTALSYLPKTRALDPVKAFGGNPLLAFILCWSLFPWLDVWKIGEVTARSWGQDLLLPLLPANHASFLFSLIATALLSLPILYCQKRGWFLRL
jgi:predicted acyltransferase